MRYLLLIAVFAGPVMAAPPVQSHSVKLNGHTFTLPVGYTIELVAASPLVERPIHAAFDERGNLYVADSSGSNDPVETQLAQKPHRIVKLQDTKGTGHFDKSEVFADKLMFPEGALWHNGSLYVAAPPSIWKFDGRNRSEWFQGKTLTGCANDLHGPYLGPDGWIYWCKGAFAEQTYERPGRKPLVTKAAHIFRARPDGTGIEPVMTGGMDNPVEVAFLPGGDRVFTTTFLQHPAGGKRDGIIHAVYGGVWGKENTALAGHPRTAPDLMPVLAHLGAAAPSGLMRYEPVGPNNPFVSHLFCAQFNMHKISRHQLERDGATYKSTDSDFLVSDNFDFHPTDVLEDADGSLLVLDTGGWYKLCCPSSQLAKPDIRGAIYRVRKTDAEKIDDPRGLKFQWDSLSANDLGKLLNDPRPVVRRQAAERLVVLGDRCGPVLNLAIMSGSEDAVWAATRIGGKMAESAWATAFSSGDYLQLAALNAIALHRASGMGRLVERMLVGEEAPIRRAAAEALGRMGRKSAIPAILNVLAKEEDRIVVHSLIYALMELDDREQTLAGMQSPHAKVRRAALLALDGMENGKLESGIVVKELTDKDPALRTAAWWIASRHPEWAESVSSVLKDRLRTAAPADAAEMEKLLATFATAETVQAMMAKTLADSPPAAQRMVLHAMRNARLKAVPRSWLDAILAIDRTAELWPDSLAVLRQWKLSSKDVTRVRTALMTVSVQDTDAVRRLNALAAMPGGAELDAPLWNFVAEQLRKDAGSRERPLAVSAIASARLDATQLTSLAGMMKSLTAMEVDRLLESFSNNQDEMVGTALLAALEAFPGQEALRVDRVKTAFARCGGSLAARIEKLCAAINVDGAAQAKKIDTLLPLVKDGDIRRGQAVFLSAKANCAACHAIGYQGGTIGPDLTGIGKIRTERDLLESVLFPSASLVRSYEPVKIVLQNGKVHQGNIRTDTGDTIVLQVAADQQVTIPRNEIDEMTPGKTSLMPAGLDQQMTPQELADLVAFLKSRK